MTDFVTLSCPSCRGKLKITNDINQFACGYCGNEFMVNRGENTISLAPVVESINQVRQGVDRIAIELQIQRLQRERLELANHIQAKRKSFEYWYTSQSGLFGVIRSLFSSQKQQDKAELTELYALARQKREEQERLTALLSQ